MVISDNLAAHALGGYFCNFSSVKRFCRFCNRTKHQIEEAILSGNFTLCTNEGNDNIVEFPNICSVYGMKSKLWLNQLKYFHVSNGLPLDLAHDLFKDLAIGIMNLLVTSYLQANVFTFDDLSTVIQRLCYSELIKSINHK